ncbi:metalloregulator ArsR/SmtB family transcription factor [Algoriphagus sp. AGSA1]|uniref:ArsR/SmtB family transcription factor n=1 Tax=Algoriphagus sp. AGSA1 TaxID=2907213 RepID=UPI001F369629|nr:metalloregulator ArsR/SmtB family transcription factor [Algoriphagus sp. AGSA1]MCE7057701.1 metalloregulator ArsR/SmtB family transcription factor [Algoriphagus sp. AGSA1]
MRRDVFQAIADPTRREIIDLLAEETMNLNSVAGNFEISRPAISKHMRVLQECGLVIIHKEGRERYCKANLQSLEDVSNWIGKYRQFWDEGLNSLKQFLEKDNK